MNDKLSSLALRAGIMVWATVMMLPVGGVLYAAPPASPVVFQGIAGSADASQVRLWFTVDGHGSGWIKPGQAFGDYELVRYDAKKFTATLQKGDATFDLDLQAPHVKSGAGSVLTHEQALKALQGWWTVRDLATGEVFRPPLEVALENSDQTAVWAQMNERGHGNGDSVMLVRDVAWTWDDLAPEMAAALTDADLKGLKLTRAITGGSEYTTIFKAPKTPASPPVPPGP